MFGRKLADQEREIRELLDDIDNLKNQSFCVVEALRKKPLVKKYSTTERLCM